MNEHVQEQQLLQLHEYVEGQLQQLRTLVTNYGAMNAALKLVVGQMLKANPDRQMAEAISKAAIAARLTLSQIQSGGLRDQALSTFDLTLDDLLKELGEAAPSSRH